jgi:hypothetical protein
MSSRPELTCVEHRRSRDATRKKRAFKTVRLAALLIGIGIAIAPAPRVAAQRPESSSVKETRRFYPDDPIQRDDDMRDIPAVAEFDLSKSYEFVNETFGNSVTSVGPALNVNTLGEVPDSSWFTNRLGLNDMTIAEVVRGPDRLEGPAAGTWQVTGRPDSGITPKFTIRDARGDIYLIKLDPASNPELPSSVEVIATKIFHAIGYHVPEDYVVTFDRSRLAVAEGARIRTDSGDRRAIRMDDIDDWLRDVPRSADGRIRALASRFVPGRVVGQFRFTGTRSDDPNDIYPHERRRELRGLRVFAAWLNHDDARSINSIDTYVEDNGRHYIRHYLQDFGSVLGSGSTSAQQPRGGNEYLIDGGSTAKGLVSFGLWQPEWTKVRYRDDPALGNIEADFFDPAKWKTEYPQPAFDQMDSADAFWAARIASRFTDPMIRSIVETARLSNPETARILGDIIIRRRDKVVSYWITRTNPLDRFAVAANGGGATLTFDNAAVRAGAAQPGAAYTVRWIALDNAAGTERAAGSEVRLTEPRAVIPDAAWGPNDGGASYAVASIETMHPAFSNWTRPVRVTVRRRNAAMDIVGIERPTQ